MPNASGSSSSRRSGSSRGGSGGGRPSGGRPKSGGSRGSSGRGRSSSRGASDSRRDGGGRSDSRGGSSDSRDGSSRGSRGKAPVSGRSDSRGGPRGNGSGRNDSRGNSRGSSRGSSRGDSRGSSRGDSRGSSRGNSRSGSSRGPSRGGSRDGYQGRRSRDDVPKKPARAETSGWGSVAQHGAAGATIGQRMFEQEAEEQFSPDERRKFEERQAKRAKVAEKHEGLREQARNAIDRGALPTPKTGDVAKNVTVERMPLPGRPPNAVNVEKLMERIAGEDKAARGWRLFKRAAKEFQNEQFTDSRKTVKPLVESYPNVADLHELHGLSLYRLGKWDEAIESLEAFRRLSGTAEQNPVLMDCHRALGHWADVEYLWKELGELSPSGELVSEGRIVMAGTQADMGFIDSGVRTLEKGWKIPREPMDYHLRRAYALADLLERDGKIPKSRKLFAWIASKDPSFGDSIERAEG